MTEPEFKSNIRQPLVFVISGPSGAGKDSVIQCMKERGLSFHFVVTATTRAPRKGEVNGVDYIFLDSDEFARMIAAHELLEYARVYNDYKGIPRAQVDMALKSGKDVIMRVDVQGAATLRKELPDAVQIFLVTESEEDLVSRLKARATETPDDFTMRVVTARQELRRAVEFDYNVVNKKDQLGATVDVVEHIISAEHHRVKHGKTEA